MSEKKVRLKAKQDRSSITVQVNDLIGPDNEVRLIDAFIEKLDLASHSISYKTKKEGIDLGGPSEYDPKDLLRIYIYGYLNRIRSSRLLAEACKKNIEMIWLLGNLSPSHNTINEFRRTNYLGLYLIFQTFNVFWQDLGLFSEEESEEEETDNETTYASDGSRFSAQNSKSNNYNLEKIEANLNRYDKKAAAYLKELSELEDGQDGQTLESISMDKPWTKDQALEENLEKLSTSKEDSSQVQTRKEVIQTKLEYIQKGKQRNLALKQALIESGETQISLIDPDARRLTKNGNSIVGYNVQISTEATHKLIAHFDVVNKGDIHLFAHLGQLTAGFLTKGDSSITVNGLGDKGYDDGEQIYRSGQMGITTYISPNTFTNSQKPKAFRKDKFEYDKPNDSYWCPQGKRLVTNGKLYKKGDRRAKEYRCKTNDCIACPFKEQCLSKSSLEKPLGRVISRTEFEDAKDANKQRVLNNKELYKKRKEIVEHPFGTIKRQWGYDYTLLKGFAKVTGEFALIFSVYNLRRAITQLGINAVINKLNERERLVFFDFFSKWLLGHFLCSVIGVFAWSTPAVVRANSRGIQ